MNHLEVLARLIADLYQQIAELNAAVQQKDAEIDALMTAVQSRAPRGQEEPADA